MRIFFASRKNLLVEAMSRILMEADEFVISGVIRSLDEFSNQKDLQTCDVIILTDPGFSCSTLNAVKKLQTLSKNKPVVLVTCSGKLESAGIFFRHSVRAILTKDCEPSELYNAIRKASNGKPYVTPAIAQALAHDLSKSDDGKIKLSPREAEIVGFIARGTSTSEIARILRLSTKTVSAHKSSIKLRLHLRGTTEIVQYAIENGYLRHPVE